MTRKHTKRCWSIVCLMLLTITGGPAWAVILDASSFDAVRELLPPDNGVPEQFPDSVVAAAGGISGAGDVFGVANSLRGHVAPCPPDQFGGCNHLEDPVLWKRSDGYAPRVTFGQHPTFASGNAFNLSSDFAAVLDGAKAHPEQAKGCGEPKAPACTFVVPDSVRTEFANNSLPVADNAVLTIGSPGASWSISSSPTPTGCFNTGEPCEQQDYRITNLAASKGENAQGLQVNDSSPTHPHGVHMGRNNNTGRTRKVVGVSEDGFVGGTWHVNNWNAFLYDMNTDVFTDFHGGQGMSANNNGIVVSSFADYSEGPPAFVGHPDAISEENPKGWIYEFENPLRLWHINDANEIVGTFEDNPIRIRPTGTTVAGGSVFPTYDQFNPDTDKLAELGPAFSNSEAYAISSSDPAFTAGQSFSFVNFGPSGVIWGEDGNVLTELGGGKIPHGITHDGTIAYGSFRDAIGGAEQAAMWMTNDGWATFTEVLFDDLLDGLVELGVEGADLVGSFSGSLNDCCWVSGVNNDGQIVVSGLPPELGSLGESTPLGTAVYLLDTEALDTGGVIKGDVNNDGVVDFIDITPFINAQSAEGDEGAFLVLTPNGCFLCADIDMDGAIDFLDITPFVNLLDQIGAAAVPEPSTLAMLSLCLLALRRRRGLLNV